MSMPQLGKSEYRVLAKCYQEHTEDPQNEVELQVQGNGNSRFM